MAVPDRGRNRDDARQRNLRKKLVQIVALEDRLAADPALNLTSEQREKLGRKLHLEAELKSLLTPTGAACVFSSTASDGIGKAYLDTDVTACAKCSLCKLLVKPFPAPWSNWYCSQCGKDRLTLHSPAYGCCQQEVCVKLDTWAICENCAKADDVMKMERFRGIDSCDKGSDSSCSTQVCASCHPCCQDVQNLTSPWLCSESGQDELSSSPPPSPCLEQEGSRSMQDLAVCGDSLTNKSRSQSCDGLADDLLGTVVPSMTQSGKDDLIAAEKIVPPSEATKCEVSFKAGVKGKKADIEDFEILTAVQPFAAATQASDRLRGLIQATTELSLEVFGTDALEGVSRKGKWKVTLFARRSTDAPRSGLLGFIVYKVKPSAQSVSIAHVAVIPEERGKGLGQRIVNWCVVMTKQQQNIEQLVLWALPSAIKFWQLLGFRAVQVRDLPADPSDKQCDVPGQVYMEYHCKRRRGGGGSKTKRR